ncbi:FHA domain-containing protein [Leptolyngbya sp. FACHB-541]|uniref:FHA domain-containing protein n=1 Tax=Leptolyngbya sp. FACHB-541 TaxID=2692810 RepID=UPI0016844123|nr:FHA domain-containing protein [Leptolyngbya sp. FACHB-541]MBD2000123.1 FHA domain-containing protein [Leptolyngbya sp. FACHB-541]
MSVKSEKLVKSIQEIQQFIAARSQQPGIQQHSNFEAIAQTLEKSVASLKEGKLTLQIVSHNPNSAKALYDLLRNRELSAAYQFKVTPLTDDLQLTQSEPTAALILQTDASPQRYQLSATDKLAIGRHPECQILIPDPYVSVSGYHANIQPCVEANSNSAYVSWQICDLSRNGTYINEQQVQGCQILIEGDRITLGAPTSTETSPELLFEYQSITDSSSQQFDTLVTECDVLCWVINPQPPLTAAEQQLLEKIRAARFTNLLVIAELSDSFNQPEAAKLHQSRMNAWLQTSPLDVFCFPLCNSYIGASAAQLSVNFQHESDKFFKLLESLVKRKPEDILTKRLTAQVLAQLHLVEQLIDLDERKLARETERDEAKLKEPGQNQIREKVDTILKQIQDDKAIFFKQTKDKLKQSKVDLLDDYLENSISCKIRRFLDQLKPNVVKYRGRKYIQLRFSTIEVVESKRAKRKPLKPETVEEKTIDANTALMNFCRSELSWWSDEQWEILCLCPQSSLRELLQRAYEMLHSIPSVNLNRSLFQPEQSIDNRAVFEEAFAMPLSESRYQEASPIVYMLKKIRGQWMQFIFMFSFFSVLGIAGRRQIMQHISAPIVNAFKASPYISTIVLLVILYFLFRSLIRLYREDRDLEREKEAEKIRNNLRSYYQALAKNRLVERLVQNLTTALEVEEQRVEKILQAAKHQTTRITTETESNQAPIRKRILKHEVLQKELRSDRDKLQKLRRVLEVKS